jgi:hypothetical protein
VAEQLVVDDRVAPSGPAPTSTRILVATSHAWSSATSAPSSTSTGTSTAIVPGTSGFSRTT